MHTEMPAMPEKKPQSLSFRNRPSLPGKIRFRILLGLLSAGLVLFCSNLPQPVPVTVSNPSLDAAFGAYSRLELGSARRILEQLAASANASTLDKAISLQFLALLDTFIYRNYGSARERLRRAEALGQDRSTAWSMLSMVERQAGRYEEAQAAALRALNLAETLPLRVNARLHLASAILHESIQAFKAGRPLDPGLLQEAGALLSAVLADEPCLPDAADMLLGISLLRNDGPTALDALKAYYRISDNEPVRGMMAEPARVLVSLLPNWNGRPLSRDERERLVLALSQARFSEYAALLATDPRIGAGEGIQNLPAVRNLVAYVDFLQRAESLFEDDFRQEAIWTENATPETLQTNPRESGFQDTLLGEMRRFWQELSFDGQRPAFCQDAFRQEVLRRFGLIWNYFSIGDRQNPLIAGHTISFENRTFEQQGHRVNATCIVLDRMVTEGYPNWFLGILGEGGIGGFTDGALIYAFRSFSISDSFYFYWDILHDPGSRADYESELAAIEAADDGLARQNPYRSLPGLSGRLTFDFNRRIYDRLVADGLEGEELSMSFMSELINRRELRFFHHEGRHIIDSLRRPNQEEMEYRAKLSEIILDPDPKVAFVQTISGMGERNDPHTMADERILRIVVDWMGAHRGEIPGLDPQRPMLPQFNLLTDEQLRSILRANDPLGNS